MTKPNNGGRPQNAVVAELTERLGVSPRRVQQLIVEYGIAGISDIEVLRVEEKKILIALRGLRTQREQHDLEVARRNVIPKAEALEYGMKLGEMVNRLVGEALANWPGQLAGKDELQIREILGDTLGEFVTQLRDEAKQL